MKVFDLKISVPFGAILVGGHHAAQDGDNIAHAKDAQGRPVIPSTAIRGALRQSLEALLRGALPAEESQKICFAGWTEHSQSNQPGEACAKCVVCRLFGGQTDQLTDGLTRFSSLTLEDALLNEHCFASFQTRHGNAVNRAHRSVEEDLLFQQHVAQLAPGDQFTARLTLDATSESNDLTLNGQKLSMETLVRGAVRATTHIGAGRSRGLGHVRMRLVEVEPEAHETSNSVSAVKGELRLLIRLKSQTCIGQPVALSNLVDTRTEIPGATLRGVFGFGLAENAEDENALKRLTDPKDGAIYDFAWPVDDSEAQGVSAPLPLTALECKARSEEKEACKRIIADDLIPRIVSVYIDNNQIEKTKQIALRECPHCEQPLRAAKGTRRMRTRSIDRRALTRTSINRATDSVRESALFTQTLLMPELTFEGSIRNVKMGDEQRLIKVAQKNLTVGKGRSRGWGKVQIEITSGEPSSPLADRVQYFNKTIKKYIEYPIFKRIIPLTALSPIVPFSQSEDTDDSLHPGDYEVHEALEKAGIKSVNFILKVRRYVIEGVWVQRNADEEDIDDRRIQAVQAGSVFVIELPEGKKNTDDDVLKAIELVEAQGIGRRTRQGFGRMLAFDPMASDSLRIKRKGQHEASK
ncbi:MAG: RAMP superfamily CRISPR-associated protein [Myxococcota bacterium]